MKNRFYSATPTRYILVALVTAFAIFGLACTSDEATPTPEPTATPALSLDQTFADVPGIVDPTNFGWPRVVETSEGRVELAAPPERVFSLSLGHSEIIAALVGVDRLVAVSSFYKDPTVSAIWAQFEPLPVSGSDPEEIISHSPDFAVASTFTNQELTAQLKDLDVPVVRTDLENSALGNIPNILLLGYIFGAEDRAIELTEEVRERVQNIRDLTATAASDAPRVLSMSRYSDVYVAGDNTTEGEIIEAAGGINVAASGIEGHQTASFEGIVALNPDIILLTQPEDSALELAEEMYAESALADIPAVKNRMILYVNPTFYTTLSHWNVRGIEESAKLFYPDLFEGVQFPTFSAP